MDKWRDGWMDEWLCHSEGSLGCQGCHYSCQEVHEDTGLCSHEDGSRRVALNLSSSEHPFGKGRSRRAEVLAHTRLLLCLCRVHLCVALCKCHLGCKMSLDVFLSKVFSATSAPEMWPRPAS